MAYKEPGVYLKAVNTVYASASAAEMYPCVIGPGAATLVVKNVKITRSSSGDTDVIEGYESTCTSLIKIAAYSGGAAAYTKNTDYTLATSNEQKVVSWTGTNKPDAGTAYYVDLEYTNTNLDLTLVYSKEELHSKFGYSLGTDGTTVNKLVAVADILFDNNYNNGLPVFIQQVEVTSGSTEPTSTQWDNAIAKTAKDARIWRLIPSELSGESAATVESKIIASVVACSTYEERKERTTILSGGYLSSHTTPETVISVVGAHAQGLDNKRVSYVYPDSCSVVVSNETTELSTTLDGQAIAAAIAGYEQANICSKSRTRAKLLSISALGGVYMTRTQMNQLADDGVLIVTQNLPGENVIVRHQLTTDMDSVQTKEMSVIAISDYCAKTFRSVCETYIGVYNINTQTISMIDGSLKLAISELVRSAIINSGSVTSVVQDADNLDTVLASVRVSVPYPCNYIDITMYLD